MQRNIPSILVRHVQELTGGRNGKIARKIALCRLVANQFQHTGGLVNRVAYDAVVAPVRAVEKIPVWV